jgi:hypothetical protein
MLIVMRVRVSPPPVLPIQLAALSFTSESRVAAGLQKMKGLRRFLNSERDLKFDSLFFLFFVLPWGPCFTDSGREFH